MGYFNGSKAEPKAAGKPGRPGIGFQLTSGGDFDLQAKKLTNVAMGTANGDAITKQQIDSKVDKVMTDHLDANFKEIKNVSRGTDADAFPLSHGKSIFLTTNGSKFDAKNQQITNLVTNTADNASAVNVSALNLAIANSSSSSGVITQDLNLQNQFNVVNSKQRNRAQLKTDYDSLMSYEEVNRNVLSRVEEFPMGTQLNMNHNSITNLKTPIYAHEAATKGYADGKLSLSGGRMTNSINMGANEITNLAAPTGSSNASTKKYVDDTETSIKNQISREVTQIQTLLNAKLALTGGTMSGDLNMGNKKITNLETPTDPADAATKDFVEKSHITQSGLQENVFRYLMADMNESSSESNNTVLGILRFAGTPHTLFKNAYKFTIAKDGNNQYISRIGFNFNPVPTGSYTFVVEYFPPTQTNVSVDCVSTPLNVDKQIKKKFPTYIKDVAQIRKWQMATPDYLMIDMHCDGTASSPANGVGWLIVYGVTGTHNDVSSSVLDTQFITASGEMQMQVGINMNNFRVTNLPEPTGPKQPATKQYVDTAGIYSILSLATYVDGYIKENAACMYLVEKGSKDEAVFGRSTRGISTLFDKTLSGADATQSVPPKRPVLSTVKNAKRFFWKFDGSKRMLSRINLNAPSGGARFGSRFHPLSTSITLRVKCPVPKWFVWSR